MIHLVQYTNLTIITFFVLYFDPFLLIMWQNNNLFCKDGYCTAYICMQSECHGLTVSVSLPCMVHRLSGDTRFFQESEETLGKAVPTGKLYFQDVKLSIICWTRFCSEVACCHALSGGLLLISNKIKLLTTKTFTTKWHFHHVSDGWQHHNMIYFDPKCQCPPIFWV
jgi:hypothetical protein